MTVLDAIALSSGFKDFAKVKKIYVLRTDANGKQQRLPFNYKDVIKGKNAQENIELQPRDTVVVP
jgi:polysaccharide export outer membrane protein